ncbi:endonuclease/exonuclease/phosphatase family protein [Tropicimonas sp. IMCC34011]|uniref:endonuclease/exonuclease/phosphatase family protein n=1 Tax=Tropicimonas sp. IMCC34011 TaxID=2248759 RepID=UPI00130045F7|nr:endonuclease/exonuclease/phosphatase family protein [Tropicimonas sp. IMCC34011]
MSLPPPLPGKLRLASWNVRKCFGLDWRRDPERVARGIARLGADVVTLQEADWRLGPRHSAIPPDTIRELAGMEPLPAGKGTSLGHHGNAMLVREHVEVASVTPFDLMGIGRGGILAELSVREMPFRLVGTHFSLVRRTRLSQQVEIVKRLSALEAGPVAIMGDFNEFSRTAGFAPFRVSKFDVREVGNSFHATYAWAPLDRFVLKGLHMIRGGVADGPEFRRASDHLPIWADIAWPPG